MKDYESELLAFEPKMRGMVKNFRACGYRFDGSDDDDLIQELFLKAIEVKERYNPDLASLRTFWYTCFRNRLVAIAESGDRAMLWAVGIMRSNSDFDILDPTINDPFHWRPKVQRAVWDMISELYLVDSGVAVVCEELISKDGSRLAVADGLKMPVTAVNYAMTKLRNWSGFQKTLDMVPF